jgi:alpha-1,3-rhamnosyltransferase
MVENNTPLVSIIVITYNSSKYVLETLESAKDQTYINIELIISDDCSTDNTVEICKIWLEENKDRFVRTELVTISKNSGVPANCNRGIYASLGKWVKLIAGDDALFDDAIENVVKIANKNPLAQTILTQVEVFDSYFSKEASISIQPTNWQSNAAFSELATPNSQLEYILNGGYHSAIGIYFKNNIFEEIGHFEEEYNLIEDEPFFLKIALNGKKILFAPLITAKYRKSNNSLTSINNKVIPTYMYQANLAIYRASLKNGKRKFIINSFYNKTIIFVIMKFGNKGSLLGLVNKFRLTFQPIRFYNLFNKLKIKFNV